jgi:hypothetical protein
MRNDVAGIRSRPGCITGGKVSSPQGTSTAPTDAKSIGARAISGRRPSKPGDGAGLLPSRRLLGMNDVMTVMDDLVVHLVVNLVMDRLLRLSGGNGNGDDGDGGEAEQKLAHDALK